MYSSQSLHVSLFTAHSREKIDCLLAGFCKNVPPGLSDSVRLRSVADKSIAISRTRFIQQVSGTSSASAHGAHAFSRFQLPGNLLQRAAGPEERPTAACGCAQHRRGLLAGLPAKLAERAKACRACKASKTCKACRACKSGPARPARPVCLLLWPKRLACHIFLPCPALSCPALSHLYRRQIPRMHASIQIYLKHIFFMVHRRPSSLVSPAEDSVKNADPGGVYIDAAHGVGAPKMEALAKVCHVPDHIIRQAGTLQYHTPTPKMEAL